MLALFTVEGRMSVDRRLLSWGVFLVLLGGVPLAVAQGWIPRDVVARAWELWPLILIGVGIGLILRRTPLHLLGGLVAAGTCGLILGSFLAVGFGGISVGGLGCGAAAGDAPRILSQQGTFGGGTASVTLAATCSSVRVAAVPGSGWAVTVNGAENARPTVEASTDRLAVRSPEHAVVFPFGSQRSSWQADLGRDTRYDLALEVNAGDARVDLAGATLSALTLDANAIGNTVLDLSGATVDRLDVSVNAASVAIRLPESASLAGAVEGNAASVGLCAAPGVGLRLVVEDNLTASNNYAAQGLVRQGNAWESPGYANATTRVELRTTGNAISYTLAPKDGCR
jgi:hypothetical protein